MLVGPLLITPRTIPLSFTVSFLVLKFWPLIVILSAAKSAVALTIWALTMPALNIVAARTNVAVLFVLKDSLLHSGEG